jgi:hypothetical protein
MSAFGATRTDLVVRYRARESFSYEGRLVAKDENPPSIKKISK